MDCKNKYTSFKLCSEESSNEFSPGPAFIIVYFISDKIIVYIIWCSHRDEKSLRLPIRGRDEIYLPTMNQEIKIVFSLGYDPHMLVYQIIADLLS